MKKAVMYGAGNIGRGFIGQLFSLSGYEVVFLDINAKVIDKIIMLLFSYIKETLLFLKTKNFFIIYFPPF